MHRNEADAERLSGWPDGYLNIASSVLDITDGAPGKSEEPAERGTVIKMIFNALLGPYRNPVGYDNGVIKYSTNKTLGEVRFDVKEGKGVLKATATTSVANKKLLANQILIDVDDDGSDDDDGTIYNTTLTGIDSLVGSNIVYYYQDKASDEKVLSITSSGTRSRTEELNVEDIEYFEGFDPTDTVDPAIKMYGSTSKKKFETEEEPTIVYNGQTITAEDLENLPDSDARKWTYKTEKDENGEDVEVKTEITLNEFLKPKMGSVRLIDSNANGRYETVVVEKYETLLVSAATASRLSGKIDNVSTSLTKLDDTEKIITVTRAGDEVRVRNLKTNDVASIKRDLNEEVIDIVVTGESFTGKITSLSSAKKNTDEDMQISVDGTKYPIDKNAIDDASAGKECVFYTDSFGRIGYIEAASANGMLGTGEAYGWIMSAYTSEDGESRMIRMMTADGAKEYSIGDKLDIWLNGQNDHDTVSGADLNKVLDDMAAAIRGDAGYESFFMRSYTGSVDSPDYVSEIRLAKFKANASNDITKLYLAVDSQLVEDEEALRIRGLDLKGTPSQGASVGGFQVPDGILEITAPNNRTDMRSASNYSFGSVTSSAYVVRENGTTRSFVLGEFEDAVTPTILINFATSATAAEVFTNMDSAGGGPSMMIVDSVDQGYDDDDNEMYTINGYLSGAEASVKTNKNTNIGWLPNNFWTSSNNGRNFDGYSLWSVEKGYHAWVSDPEAPATDEIVSSDVEIGTVEDIISEGDLILYSGDGKLIAKYIDASVMSDYVDSDEDATSFPKIVDSQPTKRDPLATRTLTFNPLGQHTNNSSSRVGYYFAKVADVDSETAWVKLEGVANPIVFDPTKTMDIVEVNGSKVDINPDGVGSAADIQVGDYLYVSTANKGDINSLVIYRFD